MDAVQDPSQWEQHQCRQADPVPQDQPDPQQGREVSEIGRVPDDPVYSCVDELVLFKDGYSLAELPLQRGHCRQADRHPKEEHQAAQIAEEGKECSKAAEPIGEQHMFLDQECKKDGKHG